MLPGARHRPRLSDASLRAASRPGHETSLHRGVDQTPQQVADIFALAGALHHEHREQVFRRIDEEERAGHAAPEELAERARERRDPAMGADGEAEAKTVTWRHQRRVDLYARAEMIRGHQLQRLAADDPVAVERAAVEQHLAEACVIH